MSDTPAKTTASAGYAIAIILWIVSGASLAYVAWRVFGVGEPLQDNLMLVTTSAVNAAIGALMVSRATAKAD